MDQPEQQQARQDVVMEANVHTLLDPSLAPTLGIAVIHPQQQQSQHQPFINDNSNPSIPHQQTHTTNYLTNKPYSTHYHSLLDVRRNLPVYKHRKQIWDAVLKNKVVVIQGETGSGKSTQIPFIVSYGLWRYVKNNEVHGGYSMMEQPDGIQEGVAGIPGNEQEQHQHQQQQQPRDEWTDENMKQVLAKLCINATADQPPRVVVTQPRRVAATNLAKRVAEEQDVTLGEHVGYSVRFDDCSDARRTRIKYCTDGMLLRESLSDNTLSAYSVVIIDEAHERSLSTDILLGQLKRLLNTDRKDNLRLVIMSATLDVSSLRTFYGENTPRLFIPGRMFPVDVRYEPKAVEDYVHAAVDKALQIHAGNKPGDILIFLTGEDEIETAASMMRNELQVKKQGHTALILPCYASLPPKELDRVFKPAPLIEIPGLDASEYGASSGHRPRPRKIVVATNIAETSITIDGVVFVIDSGFAKQKVFHPGHRLESLLVSPISRDCAKQRTGRAGRTQPGICFRLYTEEAFTTQLSDTFIPEMLRSNLANTVLQLLKMGVQDVPHFDYVDAPAPETMMRALESLFFLRAVDDKCKLTRLGHLMSKFPLEPSMSRILIESCAMGCSFEIVRIVAMLNVGSSGPSSVFLRPKNKSKLMHAMAAKRSFEEPCSDHITLLNVYLEYDKQKQRFRAPNLDNPKRNKIRLVSEPLETDEDGVESLSPAPSRRMQRNSSGTSLAKRSSTRGPLESSLASLANQSQDDTGFENQATFSTSAPGSFMSPEGTDKMQPDPPSSSSSSPDVSVSDWCWKHYVNLRALQNADSIRGQLESILTRNGLAVTSCGYDQTNMSERQKAKALNVIRRALIKGLFLHSAVRLENDNKYVLFPLETEVAIHPSSGLDKKDKNNLFAVYEDFTMTPKLYLRTVTAVEAGWLIEEGQDLGYYNLDHVKNSNIKKLLKRAFRSGSSTNPANLGPKNAYT